MTRQGFDEEMDGIHPGTILLWTGTIDNIPSRWSLCDGNDDTPDLRNKMAKGTPSKNKSPGDTAGTNTYSISSSQMPTHDHSGSTNTTGSHTHHWSVTRALADPYANNESSHEPYNYRASTTKENDHRHGVSLGTAGSKGPVNNLPSHREVAYIMRL